MSEAVGSSARLRDTVRTAIGRARQLSGLDRAPFARRMTEVCGELIHRDRIRRWEEGEAQPEVLHLLAAAQLAGVPLSDLFEPEELEARLSLVERELAHLKRSRPH